MDWIKSIIEKYIGEDGKLNLDATLKEINKKAPENVVPKEQYNSLADAKKKLDDDVKTRDSQLAELQKAGSVEDLQKQLTEALEANEKAEKEYKEKIADMKLDSEIEKALSGALHPELMAGKIDKSKLKINDDDTITGLDEQIKSLKESYEDMFKPDKTGVSPANPEGKDTVITKEQFAKMKYSERMELYNSNRELYDELSGGN
ncbi:MAG: hypothetical protein HFE82_06765 [Erysipelotrichaceae bacterium]|nr:hypothetical protein [Erysipelotrichaceae bacterium]